jgi:hypothetical protein
MNPRESTEGGEDGDDGPDDDGCTEGGQSDASNGEALSLT